MTIFRTKCPICEREALVAARTRHKVTASDGTIFHYEDEILRCGYCGEIFYTPEQSLASSQARRSVLRAYEARKAI
jgi:YgiT-type zinc finger domain-containing protein